MSSKSSLLTESAFKLASDGAGLATESEFVSPAFGVAAAAEAAAKLTVLLACSEILVTPSAALAWSSCAWARKDDPKAANRDKPALAAAGGVLDCMKQNTRTLCQ